MLQAIIIRVARDTIVRHSLKWMDKHYIQLTDEALLYVIETCADFIEKNTQK